MTSDVIADLGSSYFCLPKGRKKNVPAQIELRQAKKGANNDLS